jgi:hypothetical protein
MIGNQQKDTKFICTVLTSQLLLPGFCCPGFYYLGFYFPGFYCPGFYSPVFRLINLLEV